MKGSPLYYIPLLSVLHEELGAAMAVSSPSDHRTTEVDLLDPTGGVNLHLLHFI